MSDLLEANPRIHLGANHPPEEVAPKPPTPFELARNAINDLYDEAKNWLDGAEIENQGQADGLGILLDSLRRAEADADAARKAEVKPFDEGKAEIQARYAPLIADTKAVKGKTVLAIEAVKAAGNKWLLKLDAEKCAREKKLADEAAAAKKAAEDALQAAAPDDLEAKEAAEALITTARVAQAGWSRATHEKVHLSGGNRALGLRTSWKATLTDRRAACIHYWSTNPEAFDTLLQSLADADVRSGKRKIDGFDIAEVKSL